MIECVAEIIEEMEKEIERKLPYNESLGNLVSESQGMIKILEKWPRLHEEEIYKLKETLKKCEQDKSETGLVSKDPKIVVSEKALNEEGRPEQSLEGERSPLEKDSLSSEMVPSQSNSPPEAEDNSKAYMNYSSLNNVEGGPFALQCPVCCCILETPCFNDGCKDCGATKGFTKLYADFQLEGTVEDGNKLE